MNNTSSSNAVGPSLNGYDADSSNLTVELQRYLMLLHHASACTYSPCELHGADCEQMKRFISHTQKCTSNCVVCIRYSNLVRLHVNGCRASLGKCPVIGCAQNGRNSIQFPNSFQNNNVHMPGTSLQGLGHRISDIMVPSQGRRSILPLVKSAKFTSVCPLQRLVLLQHADSCHASDCSICGVPWCNAAKYTIEHVTQCNIDECQVPYCASSKFVLKHFAECTKSNCLVCTPLHGGSYVVHHLPFCSECSQSIGMTLTA